MEQNPSILAYMMVKIEKDGIREQTEDLDAQIAGKEAKTSRTPRVEEKSTEEVAVEETPVKESKEEKSTEEVVVEETPVKESKDEMGAEGVPAEAEVTADEKVEK